MLITCDNVCQLINSWRDGDSLIEFSELSICVNLPQFQIIITVSLNRQQKTCKTSIGFSNEHSMFALCCYGFMRGIFNSNDVLSKYSQNESNHNYHLITITIATCRKFSKFCHLRWNDVKFCLRFSNGDLWENIW